MHSESKTLGNHGIIRGSRVSATTLTVSPALSAPALVGRYAVSRPARRPLALQHLYSGRLRTHDAGRDGLRTSRAARAPATALCRPVPLWVPGGDRLRPWRSVPRRG